MLTQSIGRVDSSWDMNKVENAGSDKLKPSEEYPDKFLTAQLIWSKNIRESRPCPNQVIMGAMNPYYCSQLGLGLHLETSIDQYGVLNSKYVFNFGKTDEFNSLGEPTVPIKANAFIQRTMRRDILLAEEFLILDQDGKLGIHSVRKWATTRARRCGCRKIARRERRATWCGGVWYCR